MVTTLFLFLALMFNPVIVGHCEKGTQDARKVVQENCVILDDGSPF
jgi:hypothetical protein